MLSSRLFCISSKGASISTKVGHNIFTMATMGYDSPEPGSSGCESKHLIIPGSGRICISEWGTSDLSSPQPPICVSNLYQKAAPKPPPSTAELPKRKTALTAHTGNRLRNGVRACLRVFRCRQRFASDLCTRPLAVCVRTYNMDCNCHKFSSCLSSVWRSSQGTAKPEPSLASIRARKIHVCTLHDLSALEEFTRKSVSHGLVAAEVEHC